MGGNDEAKISAWITKLDFGINTLPRAFAIDSPKPGLVLGCILLFTLLSMVHIISKDACISFNKQDIADFFFL